MWFNSTQAIELLNFFTCLQIQKYKNTLNFWLCKKHTWNKLLIQNEKMHQEILFFAVCSVLKHTCSLVLYLHEWFCIFVRSFLFKTNKQQQKKTNKKPTTPPKLLSTWHFYTFSEVLFSSRFKESIGIHLGYYMFTKLFNSQWVLFWSFIGFRWS